MIGIDRDPASFTRPARSSDMIRTTTWPHSGTALRTLLVTGGFAAAILAALVSVAPAQNRPNTSWAETRGQRPAHSENRFPTRAPIGHLQPEPRNLPPGLLNEDISRTREQIDFDKSLRICRDC
jgi:hypothetical protein